MPFSWREMLIDSEHAPRAKWFREKVAWPCALGPPCWSDQLISIHYVPPDEIRFIHFLLYKVRPFYFASP